MLIIIVFVSHYTAYLYCFVEGISTTRYLRCVCFLVVCLYSKYDFIISINIYDVFIMSLILTGNFCIVDGICNAIVKCPVLATATCSG